MDDKLTTKDAITVLRNLQDWLYYSSMNGGTSIQREAIDMSIEALKQPEIVRCKDCKYWVPGYITDNDDFIPPKCGKWQQMVGHSSDDYCSFAEMRGEQDE